MDLQQHLALSYYNEIGELNAEHKVSIVQHRETKNIYIKKILDIYNLSVYNYIKQHSFQGIPKLYELVETDDQLIIIEEYISGDTLESILKTKGALSESKVIKYTIQICNILRNLHNCNPAIIHRDIKPSNIIITPNDDVVLLDLNAAKYMNSQSTEDTQLIGTKGYAAPEQYGFGSSSTSTDIYAIGIVMNTMLAGTFCNTPVASSLSQIIQKCTELTPKHRYDSIDSLQEALLSLNIVAEDSNVPNISVAPKSFMTYLPPGFRTKNILHILSSLPIYAMIFWLSLSLEIKDANAKQLFIERVSCLIIFLTAIACICNYLDIHKIIPYAKSKNIILKYSSIIFFTILAIFLEFVFMIFLSFIAH